MACILCILQKRSAKMKGIRVSTNKRPHSGGARPFAARAEEYVQKVGMATGRFRLNPKPNLFFCPEPKPHRIRYGFFV